MKNLLLFLFGVVLLCACSTMSKKLNPYVYESARVNLKSQVLYAAYDLEQDTACLGTMYVRQNYPYPPEWRKASHKQRSEGLCDKGFTINKSIIYDLYVEYLMNHPHIE